MEFRAPGQLAVAPDTMLIAHAARMRQNAGLASQTATGTVRRGRSGHDRGRTTRSAATEASVVLALRTPPGPVVHVSITNPPLTTGVSCGYAS